MNHFEKIAKQIVADIHISEKGELKPGEITNREEAEMKISVALEKQRQMGRVDVETRWGNRWGKDGFLKRGIFTSEFLALLYGLLLLAFFPPELPPSKLCISICAITNCFVVSRMLAKQNRGVDRSGFVCLEFWVSVFSSGFFLSQRDKIGELFFILLVATNASVYIISRGMVKKLRTQTQIMQR